MTLIEIFFDENEKIYGFRVKGHSGYAKKGEDIVCAAVSALTETALLGIGKHLKRRVDYEVKSGNLFMFLKEAPDDFTEAVLETMLLGLEETEKLSPEFLRIKKIFKEGECHV